MKKIKIKNHIQIIELWGTDVPYKALAEDMLRPSDKLSERVAMIDRTRKWYQRGQIACDCFPIVVHAARKRGFDIVTLDLLHGCR